MMLLSLPSVTKKVPTIEVTIQAAPMASGRTIMAPTRAVLAKKMAASTMVPTMVTA